MLLLESGKVPDVVIFYDGVNEILAAHQSGQPILHQNFSQIEAIFENHQPSFLRYLGSLNLLQLVRLVLSQLAPAGRHQTTEAGIDVVSLADKIGQAYINNYNIVSALAGIYHFDYYFFW
jgi:hypothetical protein